MSWEVMLREIVEAWPIAIAVWLAAAWVWRKYGDPKRESSHSEMGEG